MWAQNPDTKQWTRQIESLPRQDYELLKQELEKTRYYSKCLHGTTYLPINKLDDIYDILNYTDESGWYIGVGSSPYAPAIPSQVYEIEIDSATKPTFDKYVDEYGHSLKNLFTPEKIIEESVNNYVYVDAATTDAIPDGVSGVKINLFIDGVKLIEGHRVLVKNEKTFVTLPNYTDPETYFVNNYYVNKVDNINTEYYFYNTDNGIYLYKNKELIRETDLDLYEDCIRYSIACKMGDVNRDKQWHLSRLKNGYYPLYLNGDNVEFIEKHNWLLRNRVDYNNVLDINYYDIVRYAATTIKILGYTYSLPERTIAVGEFGVIINMQGDIPNIIQNKYKVNLRSISSIDNFYWTCGDEGTLLKVDKLTFNIDKISLGTFNNLRSVSFFNNLRGFVVGEYNTIYETIDGGIDWTPLVIDEFEGYKYNKVIYHDFNKVYIGGDSGVYLELDLVDSAWTVYKRTVKKKIDDDDEFELIDNINDMFFYSWGTSNPWSLTWSGTVSFGTISTAKEAIILVTDRDNLILHNINNFILHDYIYLDYNQAIGNLNSVTAHTASIYFNSKDDVYLANLSQFPIIGSVSNIAKIVGTVSPVYTTPLININKLYNYDELALETAGDNSQLFASTYSVGVTQSVLTTDFFAGLKSKLLFLDYEIASKLNFFDDNQKYRLPSTAEFVIPSVDVNITNMSGEYNWLSYYKDTLKTWEYHAFTVLFQLDDTNKIEFSSDFRSVSSLQGAPISMTSSSLTIDLNIVKNLAPTVDRYVISKFIAGSVSITAPSATYSIYAYNDLIIVASSVMYGNVGDSLLLESSIIRSTFMINKIVTFGATNYFYCYSNLNPTILSALKASVDTIMITNLNLYYNVQTFLDRFNQHPISTGYIAKRSTSVINGISIDTVFNNYTAYYNMASVATADFVPYDMTYQKSFLDFGFKPTYNLYGYLNNINAIAFTASKEFKALPKYYNVPFSDLSMGPTGFNGIYFDTNVGTNKLYFSPSLKTEWDSYFKWTFLDVSFNYAAYTSVYTDSLYMTFTGTAGASGSGTFIDETGKSITDLSVGPPFDPYLSGATYASATTSGYFNGFGGSAMLQTAYTSDFDLSSNDFIISLNFNAVTFSSAQTLVSNGDSFYGYDWSLIILDDSTLVVYTNGTASGLTVSVPTMNINQWYNYKLERIGSTNTIYLDGATAGSNSMSITNNNYVPIISIGREYSGGNSFTGYIDDLRIQKITYDNSIDTSKLFLMNKYYDATQDWYVLEFHKKLKYSTGASVSSFDVLSRNRLDQISQDLEEMNNIQRTKSFSNYNIRFGQDDTSIIPNSWAFSNLQGELNFKFPTDSYAKAFTADHDIKEHTSAIIYVDDRNYLAFNTVRLTQQIKADINYLSQDGFGYLIVNTVEEHKLQENDGFVLALKNVIGSAYYVSPQYNGFLTVRSVIDKYTVVVNILYGAVSVGDAGTIEHFKKDAFFNYQPVDIIDVGIDKKSKRSVAIRPENILLDGSTYKLINLDLNKFKFNLVDGVNLDVIVKKYPWILEAEIDNAIIGEDVNGLVWYAGTWFCGRWFGGTWYSGEWLGGDWYAGIWDSTKVENKILFAKVDKIVKDRKYSVWKSGRWYTGEWRLGTWFNGSWYNGTWQDGEWFNGIWNDGTWNDGTFIGGTWVLGTWNDGIFNSSNKPAYWLDGKWYGGDFENGYWYDGSWAQNSGKVSRFGTKSSNSRPSIWHGGKWFAGQFHSILNLDDSGNPIVSARHSYSTWNTGIWMGGDFFGGVAFHMDMRNGNWWGGIMEELPIYGIISSSSSNAIQLQGEWRFNNLDSIWIIDNYTNTGSQLGTNLDPKVYQVRDITIDYSVPEKITTVYVFYQDNTVALPVASLTYSATQSGYRVVSHLSRSKWYSGIWENGILQDSEFSGGIWYNGIVDNSKWNT